MVSEVYGPQHTTPFQWLVTGRSEEYFALILVHSDIICSSYYGPLLSALAHLFFLQGPRRQLNKNR